MPEISFKRFTGRHFLLLCFWLGMAGASVVVWWRGAEILSYKNTWPDTASFAGDFFAVIKQRFSGCLGFLHASGLFALEWGSPVLRQKKVF